MSAFEKRTTFGVLVASRNIFNGALAVDARRHLLAQLDKLGLGYVILPAEATANGAVETPGDVRKCVQLFRDRRDEIDGIVVVLPNFGDELAVVETVSRADLRVPVLVQACNDEVDKVDLRSRRDAFCGKLSVCNNFHQYGIAWTDTAEHTCDLEGPGFAADLDCFARVCRTVKGLRRARIGAIGARTTAFQTVRYSEKLLQASGITVVTVDLSEILAAANGIGDDSPEVKQKLEAIASYGRIPARITRERVVKQAKLGVAVEAWMEQNGCDASAIQCWTSVQETYGCATCLSMSMMSERLMPSACEVDVTGAVSMYALALAAGAPPAILDWNNNYGAAKDKCVCTHCGNFPRSFIGEEPEISELGVLGTVLGPENCFGAVKGKVKPGPMTYFRMSTDDGSGRVRAYVGEGTFTDDPFPMDGGIAVTEVPRLRELLGHLCRNGFEHHVAMVRGNHARAVEEAVTRYLGWDTYYHRVE
jgi:L-fucose isomerase-like protein